MIVNFVPQLRRYSYCALSLGLTLASFGATAQISTTPVADAPSADQPAAETIPVPEAAPVPEPAPEQPAKADTATKLDAVDVTGSRIKRTDYETAQPITVIDRKEIERSGLTNIGDLLARIPDAGASINTTYATLATSGGETNLDLRNLGSDRVLILVNGHRWVSGLGGGSTVDLNNIPTSIIDHIEVLKDGASAIYGSDAIAGVVNIITIKNYDGQEFNTQYGGYQQGDGAKQQYDVSFGRQMEKTNIFANLAFSKDGTVKTTERAISAYPVVGAGATRLSAVNPNGLFEFIPNAVNGAQYQCPSLTGDLLAGELASLGALAPTLDSIPAGLQLCELTRVDGSSLSTFRAFDPATDGYNRYKDSNLQNPSERVTLFTQVSQEIFDNLTFTFEGLFNHRTSNSQLRPQAIQIGDLAGSDTYISSSNVYNPFGQDIGKGSPQVLVDQLGLGIGSGVAALRLENFPPVVSRDAYNTLHLAAGLNGNFDLLSQLFNWDVGYSYSTNRRVENRSGDYRADRLKLALGPSADCTGDCVPFDMFDGQAGITPDMIKYLAVFARNETTLRQDDAYANISFTLGDIHLPAGPIGVAAGLEYRRDQFADTPDAILQQGLSSGNNSVATAGSTAAKELYTELAIPLLADVPGAKLLDMSAAGRHSIYKGFGSTNTGKLGLRWKPYDDQLLLRGTLSTAFRAPNVGELYGGDSDSFESVADPCSGDQRNDPTTNTNCNADGVPSNVAQPAGSQLRSTVGGNRQLQPETANTLTAGFVFAPEFVQNLSLTADYYSIKLKNIITLPGGQFILDSCYTNPGRGLCQYVHRNSNGSLSNIEDREVNFAGLNTSGIDISADYLLPVDASYGKYRLDMETNYVIQYDQIVPDATGGNTTTGYVGTSDSFTGVPRWKATAGLSWQLDRFSASWQTRMIWQQNESCVDGRDPSLASLSLCSDPKTKDNGDGTTTDISENRLKTIFYHDVQLGYELSELNASIALGVRNLFNQEPPESFNPTTGGAYFNFDVVGYDIPGRFLYMKAGIKF